MTTHSQMQKKSHRVNQSHMEKICEICGDKGFQEALITCYQCKCADVHQYCVVGYYLDAPADWCCEECHIGKGVANEDSQRSNASAQICLSTVQWKKESKFPGGRCVNWEKEVKTRKTRYLPVNEALELLSGTEKNESPLINIVSSRVVSTKSAQRSDSTILERRSSDAVNESRMVNSSATTHPSDPAQVHSWMGSFDIATPLKIVPGTFNNSSIQAHPPSRVRHKVYEFSGLLPDTLKLELVPRGDIWASLFNNHCPDKEDIELYFFAKDCERERHATEIHTGLVLYMCLKDLVMRTLINDVELVILPFTTLCSDSHELNGKNFLWGLFYLMRHDIDGCADGGSDKVIDMEIDMIAGENVGTLDIVVSTANKVDMEGYQNEVDMEVDMIAGENVGTLDIVVQKWL